MRIVNEWHAIVPVDQGGNHAVRWCRHIMAAELEKIRQMAKVQNENDDECAGER